MKGLKAGQGQARELAEALNDLRTTYQDAQLTGGTKASSAIQETRQEAGASRKNDRKLRKRSDLVQKCLVSSSI